MTDWAKPVLTSLYTDVLDNLKDRDIDAGSLFFTTPTNIPENLMRYVRASNVFQEYLAGAWTTKVLALAGGGTGGANATDARTNLGIGTMGTQNANNVAITGGTITGIASFSVSGAITAGSFAGDGAGLTNLNANNLATGTIPDARFPAVLPAISGINLTNLNGYAITSGRVPTAALGSGAAGVSTFLRGDQTWAAPPAAGGLTPGALIMFTTPCPPGYTRVAAWDGYYVRMNSTHTAGGANNHAHGVGSYAAPAHTHGAGTLSTPSHNHGGATGSVSVSITVSGTTGGGGSHHHGFSGTISGTTGGENNGNMNCDAGGSGTMARSGHGHSFAANYSDDTDTVANHTHSFSGSGSGSGTGTISSQGSMGISGSTASAGGGALTGASDLQNNMPWYVDFYACMKD